MQLQTLKQAASSTRGFTLIELLVVIVIIGILATGAVSVFSGAQAKARDSQRISDLSALSTAIEQYYTDNEEYPLDATIANFKTKLESYINKWPADPKNVGGYQYVYCVAGVNGIPGQAYALAVRMEKEESAKRSHQGAADATYATGDDALSTYVAGPDTGIVGAAITSSSSAAPAPGNPGSAYDNPSCAIIDG